MECYECTVSKHEKVFTCPKYKISIGSKICELTEKLSYQYLQRGYTLLDDRDFLLNLFNQAEEIDSRETQLLASVCDEYVLGKIKDIVLFPSFEERKTAVREAKRYILSELQLNEPDTCFTLLVFLISFGVSSDLIKYLSNAKFNQKSHTPKKGLITDGEDLLKFTKTEVLQLLDGVRKSKETFKKCSIPTKYEMIDNNAFENVKEIDYLILSDNISVIGNSAFSWAVIHQLRIPSSVKKVASNAFKGFTGVIECEANSYICKYAMQRNIRYRIIN